MSSLEEYVEKLQGADETERTYAAEDLGYLNVPEAVPPLIEHLSGERSPAVRDAIFQALIRMDGDAAIEGSVRLLASEDTQIRNQAVDVLRHKGERSIPFLTPVMRDGDNHMRKLVLDVLSGIQTGGAAEIYSLALANPDPNVVMTAVENLGRIRAVESRRRIEELLSAATHPMLAAACLEALASIGDASSLAAIRRCFPRLEALPDFLLTPCLRAVAALGSAADIKDVANLLSSRAPQLRPAILGSLIALCARCPPPEPDERLLAVLRAIAEDGDPPLCRYQAVRVLGLWTAHEDIRVLLTGCLSSPERLVRLGAAESLRMAKLPALDLVLTARALEESDEEVLQALNC